KISALRLAAGKPIFCFDENLGTIHTFAGTTTPCLEMTDGNAGRYAVDAHTARCDEGQRSSVFHRQMPSDVEPRVERTEFRDRIRSNAPTVCITLAIKRDEIWIGLRFSLLKMSGLQLRQSGSCWSATRKSRSLERRVTVRQLCR